MSMELGFDFDDEYFEQTKKLKSPVTSYNVKVCYPKWFQNSDEIDKSTEKGELSKFGGDSLFYDGKYLQATDKYKQSLEYLPTQYTNVRRDILESLARCYVQLSRYSESEDLAKQLIGQSDFVSFKRQGLSLLLDIQMSKNDNIADQIETMQGLIDLDSCYAPHWHKLYTLYRRQLEVSLPGVNQMSTANLASQYSYKDKAATCLVRSQSLRKAVQKQACELIQIKNAQVLIQIEENLKELGVTKNKLDVIRNWIFARLKPDEGEENDLFKDELLTGNKFDDKWFGWCQTMTDQSVT